MKRLGYIRLILLAFIIHSGCSLPYLQNDNSDYITQMNDSMDYLEFINGLGIDRQYSDEVRQIELMRSEAESHYLAGQKHEAVRLSEACLLLCREVISNYYRSTVSDYINTLESRAAVNNSDMLGKLMSAYLDNMADIKHRVTLDTPPEPLFAIKQVITDIESLVKLTGIIDSLFSMSISVDDLFDKHSFRLNDNGRRIIRDLTFKTVELMLGQRTNVKQINFRVIGYTDQLDFGKDSRLLKQLMEQIDDDLPENQVKRRQILNLRLSELRAGEVARYIDFLGTNHKPDNYPKVKIITEVVGKGEELPPGIKPPFPIPDTRRRICRIYVYSE